MRANINKQIFNISIILCLSFFVGSASFAQSKSFTYNGHSIELDKRIIEHFGLEYVTTLETTNPDLLFYFNYFVKNAYRVEDIGQKISEPEIQSISDLSKSEKSKAPAFNSSDLAGFNILAYSIQLSDEQQVYKTGNGSEVIIVLPKKQFFEKYNSYRIPIIK